MTDTYEEPGEEVELTAGQLAQQELASRALSRRRLLPFVMRNVEGYEAGWVHKEICEKLEQFEQDVTDRKSPRLMLFMPPRSGKSELVSTQFPAWFLGRNPTQELISCSYSASLALSFSRKVRQILREPNYQSVFAKTELSKDSQSTENWLTTRGGGYLAVGVGGPATGKGANCLILDDLIKNRVDAESATDRNKVWDWYTSTAYTRLAPGGGVLLILTRWHVDDIAGRLLAAMQDGGDQWDIVSYPAIAVHDEPHRLEGEALHPARYDVDAFSKIKKAIGPRDWGALYQQNPVAQEGAILQRQYWNRWNSDHPPECEYIIQSYDTAFLKSETADYSAITTWGVFYPEGHYGQHTIMEDGEEIDRIFGGDEAHIILLDSVKGRYNFPELKLKALELYQYWQPDSVIIEGKASGLPLTAELRRIGVPVQNYTPTRGNDKIVRANSVSDMFASGYVWAPKDEWAEGLIEECHQFPAAPNDDLVDSTTQALLRFRQGGFIRLHSDYEEEYEPRSRKRIYY